MHNAPLESLVTSTLGITRHRPTLQRRCRGTKESTARLVSCSTVLMELFRTDGAVMGSHSVIGTDWEPSLPVADAAAHHQHQHMRTAASPGFQERGPWSASNFTCGGTPEAPGAVSATATAAQTVGRPVAAASEFTRAALARAGVCVAPVPASPVPALHSVTGTAAAATDAGVGCGAATAPVSTQRSFSTAGTHAQAALGWASAGPAVMSTPARRHARSTFASASPSFAPPTPGTVAQAGSASKAPPTAEPQLVNVTLPSPGYARASPVAVAVSAVGHGAVGEQLGQKAWEADAVRKLRLQYSAELRRQAAQLRAERDAAVRRAEAQVAELYRNAAESARKAAAREAADEVASLSQELEVEKEAHAAALQRAVDDATRSLRGELLEATAKAAGAQSRVQTAEREIHDLRAAVATAMETMDERGRQAEARMREAEQRAAASTQSAREEAEKQRRRAEDAESRLAATGRNLAQLREQRSAGARAVQPAQLQATTGDDAARKLRDELEVCRRDAADERQRLMSRAEAAEEEARELALRLSSCERELEAEVAAATAAHKADTDDGDWTGERRGGRSDATEVPSTSTISEAEERVAALSEELRVLRPRVRELEQTLHDETRRADLAEKELTLRSEELGTARAREGVLKDRVAALEEARASARGGGNHNQVRIAVAEARRALKQELKDEYDAAMEAMEEKHREEVRGLEAAKKAAVAEAVKQERLSHIRERATAPSPTKQDELERQLADAQERARKADAERARLLGVQRELRAALEEATGASQRQRDEIAEVRAEASSREEALRASHRAELSRRDADAEAMVRDAERSARRAAAATTAALRERVQHAEHCAALAQAPEHSEAGTSRTPTAAAVTSPCPPSTEPLDDSTLADTARPLDSPNPAGAEKSTSKCAGDASDAGDEGSTGAPSRTESK